MHNKRRLSLSARRDHQSMFFLLIGVLSLTGCSGGAPDCDEDATIDMLYELWEPHAVLVPRLDDSLGAFTNIEDITEDGTDWHGNELESGANKCRATVTDFMHGRVLRFEYVLDGDGLRMGEAEVIDRFDPPR